MHSVPVFVYEGIPWEYWSNDIRRRSASENFSLRKKAWVRRLSRLKRQIYVRRHFCVRNNRNGTRMERSTRRLAWEDRTLEGLCEKAGYEKASMKIQSIVRVLEGVITWEGLCSYPAGELLQIAGQMLYLPLFTREWQGVKETRDLVEYWSAKGIVFHGFQYVTRMPTTLNSSVQKIGQMASRLVGQAGRQADGRAGGRAFNSLGDKRHTDGQTDRHKHRQADGQSVTDRVSLARLEILPECVAWGQIEVAEWNADLSDRIVTAEAIVVEHLKVEGSIHQLIIGKTYNATKGRGFDSSVYRWWWWW